jgi:acylphosphatase
MPKHAAAAFRAIVSGRVQGVGFRWSAQERARRLGLSGWVRNLPGGDVETWAEGAPAALAAYRAWLDKGPVHAHVAAITAEPTEPQSYPSFEILE